MNRYYYEFSGFGFHNGEVSEEDETKLKNLGNIDIISSECFSKMENAREILQDKENQSIEKIAEALYCLNKEAKKIRDDREKLKVELFENYKYYDSTVREYRHPREAIKYWEEGCDWAICCDNDSCKHPEELKKDDLGYQEEHETSYCSRYNLCEDCQEEVRTAKAEIERLNGEHQKLSDMKYEIAGIYELKDEIIEWLKENKNIVPIGYHSFPDSEYQEREYSESYDDEYDNDEYDDD
jgi:hypothetical protein